MRQLLRFGLIALISSGVALADHVPGVGFDYKGTWIVVIAVGVIYSLLILSALWAYLDGQFTASEKIKYALTQPDEDWPFGRGTSLERPSTKNT